MKFIFPKNGKLSLFPIGSDAKLSLQDICNLNVQLETIQCHVFLYDVDDVFNIITPVDLNSNKLTGEVRNLFQDFLTLQVTQVANSNAWWNRYVLGLRLNPNSTRGRSSARMTKSSLLLKTLIHKDNSYRKTRLVKGISVRGQEVLSVFCRSASPSL